MKEQVKNLYLKALLIGIKGIIVLPLIVFLIYEAFITQNQEAEMSHVQYVAGPVPAAVHRDRKMDIC